MPYVDRDQGGRIVGVYGAQQHDGQEFAESAELWVPTAVLEVSMRQARRALFDAGLLGQVDALIDAMPEPERTLARIDWGAAATVRRDNALVQTLAPALGLTDAQLDTLFIRASSL